MTLELKELSFEDMKYIDMVIAEEFGHHAMIYDLKDRFCWLASRIQLPYEQGELLAVGMWGKDEDLVLKVKKADGSIYHTNSIEI